MLGSRLGATALLALLAGCGGQSRRDVSARAPTSTLKAADAVFWASSPDGPTEYRGLWRGQSAAPLWGDADGKAVLSPDRRRLFLEKNTGSVIVASDGTSLPVPGSNGYTLAWSPDGEQLALLVDGVPEIVTAKSGDSAVFDATAEGAYGKVAWAPDGSRVAFGLGTSIVQANADAGDAVVTSTGPTPLPSDQTWSLAPVWSPDSSQLAVISNSQVLWFIDRAGASFALGFDAVTPAFGWSRDGAWFAVRTPDRACIVVSPDGTTEQVAADNCEWADWSPSDSRLLTNGFGEVSTWSPGDSAPFQLGSAASYSAAWSPHASSVVYQSVDPPALVLADSTNGGVIASVPAQTLRFNAAGDRVALVMGDRSLVTTDTELDNGVKVADDVQDFTWLPDGESLAVATTREVLTLRADGSERTLAWTIPPSIQSVGFQSPP